METQRKDGVKTEAEGDQLQAHERGLEAAPSFIVLRKSQPAS